MSGGDQVVIDFAAVFRADVAAVTDLGAGREVFGIGHAEPEFFGGGQHFPTGGDMRD